MKLNMKKIYIKIVPAVLLAFAAAGCSDPVNMNDGWEDDSKSDGAPVISYITASSDIDTKITEASLNQSLAVWGDNLTDVTSVKINDIELDLSQIYQTRHRLELIVPRVIPSEVTNQLSITTKRGEVTTALVISLPELILNGFSNEFAADGDTVEVTGSNFDLYEITKEDATVTFGGNPVEIFDCTENSFSMRIPEGTPTDTETDLLITTPVVQTAAKVPFRDPGIPVLTNDSRTWQGGWWPHGIRQVAPDSDPEAPLFLWYVTMKATYSGAWQYDNVMYTHFWLDSSAADLLANPENYWFEFEILNPPTTPLAGLIKLGNGKLEGAGLIYDWDPATYNGGVSLNTMGEWLTIRLEVTDVWKGENGAKTSLYIAERPYSDWSEMNDFKIAQNRSMAGDVEYYMWNFRFVKKISAR